MASGIVSFIGAPSIVMLIALLFATYTLGIRQGRSIKSVMAVYGGGRERYLYDPFDHRGFRYLQADHGG